MRGFFRRGDRGFGNGFRRGQGRGGFERVEAMESEFGRGLKDGRGLRRGKGRNINTNACLGNGEGYGRGKGRGHGYNRVDSNAGKK